MAKKLSKKEALHKANAISTLSWLKDELKYIKHTVNSGEISVSDAFVFFDAESEIKKVIRYIESRTT